MLLKLGEHDELMGLKLRFGISGTEALILKELMMREMVTHERAMQVVYGLSVDDTPDIKIITVFVCKLRKQLKPFDVKIARVWGKGYYMTPEMKKKITELVAEENTYEEDTDANA